jgi:hypothetical protein
MLLLWSKYSYITTKTTVLFVTVEISAGDWLAYLTREFLQQVLVHPDRHIRSPIGRARNE